MVESSAGQQEALREALNAQKQIENVLGSHRLAHPYTLKEIGNVTKGEIAILGAEEVVRLGNEGLYLVKLPAQFTPDSTDPDTDE